jgi:hypothetical protein
MPNGHNQPRPKRARGIKKYLTNSDLFFKIRKCIRIYQIVANMENKYYTVAEKTQSYSLN